MKSSPVKSIGGINKGSPTTVEQKSISICDTVNHVLHMFQVRKDKKCSSHNRWKPRRSLVEHERTQNLSYLSGLRIHSKYSLLQITNKGVHDEGTRYHDHAYHAKIGRCLGVGQGEEDETHNEKHCRDVFMQWVLASKTRDEGSHYHHWQHLTCTRRHPKPHNSQRIHGECVS